MSEPSLKLIWMSPQELAENPANWRLHPETQLSALTDVISEVGWAGACLYNATTKRLIGGHARRKVALEQGCEKVPVLVGEWTEEQERKILATLDPLAAMAEADSEKLRELLDGMQTQSDALQAMMDEMRDSSALFEIQEVEESDGGKRALTSESQKKKTFVSIALLMEDVAVLESALARTGLLNRADAVTEICRSYLRVTSGASSSGASS